MACLVFSHCCYNRSDMRALPKVWGLVCGVLTQGQAKDSQRPCSPSGNATRPLHPHSSSSSPSFPTQPWKEDREAGPLFLMEH